jgi:serine/threonine protein kinase/Tol biopolymer transport system component
MTLAAGNRLGPYQILAPLGAGGMGEVYRARDPRLAREVALKVLPAEVSADRDHLARFEQEARSASALNHPNIVTVYEIGRADSTSFIAMELVEGRTLREVLIEGALSIKKVLAIAAQAADGLARAHAAGIVHRDLKPENIMVSRDGLVKVLDFGLAKPVPQASGAVTNLPTEAALTRPGVVFGTLGYMSPEQAAGKPVDFSSDQFSLGSILYEMITGRRAFQKATAVETLSAIIREEPEPLSDRAPHAPVPLPWIVERCLAKEPEERYASTRDLARELASLRDHLSETSRSEAPELPARGRRRLARWAYLAAGLAVGLAAGALLVFALSRQEDFQPTAVRFLTYSGRDYAPAVSPDGSMVAFGSDRDGRPRIWLKQITGGGEAPLTAGPDSLPRFSPDGSQILFIRSGGQHLDLYRSAIVGGEPQKLAADAAEADWSPDGRRVVFLRYTSDQGKTTSIVSTVPADAGEVRQIASVADRQLQHPRWSPGGRTVVCSETSAAGAGAIKSFFLIEAASGKVREISTNSIGEISSVAWSGSPERVVYSSSESAVAAATGSAGQVVLRNLSSGRIRPLFWTPMNADILDIVGPGRIVFDARSQRENLQEIRLVERRAAAAERWLTQGNSADRQPTYSPDAEWILFSSTRSGNLDLWMVSTKTGSVRRVTDDSAEDWDPGFTRDGQKILWSSNRSGAFEIWIMEVDGSAARPVTSSRLDAENPTATPDEAWIIFNQGAGAGQGVWKIHPDGTGAVRLVAASTGLPEVSPDGSYVSYRENLRVDLCGVRVVRLSDGSPTRFRSDLRRRFGMIGNSIGRSRWMPDGKAIVFIGQDEKGAHGLYIQDFDPERDTAATRRPLFGFDPKTALESFGISPDGARMTVAGPEQASNLMIAERVPAVALPSRPRP